MALLVALPSTMSGTAGAVLVAALAGSAADFEGFVSESLALLVDSYYSADRFLQVESLKPREISPLHRSGGALCPQLRYRLV
jgi:hypothetical protein